MVRPMLAHTSPLRWISFKVFPERLKVFGEAPKHAAASETLPFRLITNKGHQIRSIVLRPMQYHLYIDLTFETNYQKRCNSWCLRYFRGGGGWFTSNSQTISWNTATCENPQSPYKKKSRCGYSDHTWYHMIVLITAQEVHPAPEGNVQSLPGRSLSCLPRRTAQWVTKGRHCHPTCPTKQPQ